MTRATKLNPEGTLLGFGASVRLERGHDKPRPDTAMVWILFKRVDVKDDPDTTYDYRFDEASRYYETDEAPGEPPQEALDAAEALAGKE